MDEYCVFCGKRANCRHHLIFGGYNSRPIAESDDITILICNDCHTMGHITERIHDNPMAERLSKMLGQAIYERDRALAGQTDGAAIRAAFIKRYGKSYL